MIEHILKFDADLFLAINNGWACGFLDFIMPIITDDAGAFILIGILIAFSIFGKKKGIIVAIFALLAVGLADPITCKLFKPFFGRIRPCHDLPARVLTNCTGSKSFPSAHAANIFAFAISIGYGYKWALTWLLPLAVMVALSRVYVGVHYPLDITAGALLGAVLGLITGYVANLIYNRKNLKLEKELFPDG